MGKINKKCHVLVENGVM